MRTPAAILLLTAALAAADVLPAAEPAGTNAPLSTSPDSLSYDSFKIVAEKNIFNPNRSGRSPERESTRREPERRVRIDAIALVGTISYDKGDFAFFDGSSSDYRRTLKPTETIGDLTVASVSATQVVLYSANTNQTTNSWTLPIGMQLQRRDDGPWEVSSRSMAAASSPSAASASGSGGSDDVLKRLMQQRESESGGAPGTPTSPSTPAATAPSSESGSGPAAAIAFPAKPGQGPAAAPTPGGGEDEVLKRMMQRRERGE